MNKRIGCLWVRTSKDGKQYLSGVLDDLRGSFPIVAFINDKKEKENQPDYYILTSEPQEKKSANTNFVENAAKEAGVKPTTLQPGEIPVIEEEDPGPPAGF